MNRNNTQDKKLNFEDSLVKLESIIRKMEAGEQPLDKMMAQFEEGMELVAQCRKVLDEAELRVSILMKDQTGEQLKDLDESDRTKQ